MIHKLNITYLNKKVNLLKYKILKQKLASKIILRFGLISTHNKIYYPNNV